MQLIATIWAIIKADYIRIMSAKFGQNQEMSLQQLLTTDDNHSCFTTSVKGKQSKSGC